MSTSNKPAFTPIIICGAGPVGQALALMLEKVGFGANEIRLFDGKTEHQTLADQRSIAMSYGSEQILKSLAVEIQRNTKISEIHISRRRQFGRSIIKACNYNLPSLGMLARYSDISLALSKALASKGIVITRPEKIASVEEHDDYVEIALASGARHHCALLIQAEGGVFSDQQAMSQHHDYQQTAIISELTCSHPILNRAYERFTEQGPLALLPQEDGYSLVWCVRPAIAKTLMQLQDSDFLSALHDAFGDRLGRFLSTSQRYTYPLGLNAQEHHSARRIKLGNAAQTLHPVAGQGFNLGLRDAFVLAQHLTDIPLTGNHDAKTGNQLQQVLNTYQIARRSDRQTTIRLTDGMARLFANDADQDADHDLGQSLLGAALFGLDIFTPAKRVLAEQMIFGSRHEALF